MSARTYYRLSWASLTFAAAACTSTPGPGRLTPESAGEAERVAQHALSVEGSIRVDTFPQRAVGVMPLRVASGDTTLAPLAFGLADLIMADLSKSPELVVVDRLRIDATLRELDFVASGRVDTASAPRVGRLIGAHRLVSGSLVQQPQNQLGITAHIIDVSTRQIRQAASGNARLEEILRAEKEIVFRVFTELGVTLTPAQRAAVDHMATQNLSALLAYSRGVQAEVEGHFAAAAREFRRAQQLDPSFTLAATRVSQLKMMGFASPLSNLIDITADHLNRLSVAPGLRGAGSIVGSAADPSFPSQSVTVRVTIITPP